MKNLSNYSIKKKKVLFRADLNVPVINGKITDNSRIVALKNSIQKLIKQQNKIFILAHYGRPNGKIDKRYSLEFICPILESIFNVKKIHFLKSLDFNSVKHKISEINFGEICLIENIRFHPGEEKIDLNFVKDLSKSFDVYVNDAFSASHRKHASITGFAKYLPAVAGDYLLEEIRNINLFLKNKTKPNFAIIGGSKVSSKIKLLNNLIELFTTIAIGGAMANTFLLSNNHNVGKSIVEEDLINEAKKIQLKAKNYNCKLILPIDVVCSNSIKDKTSIRYCDIKNIFPNHMILDIGKKSTKLITNEILKSKMLLWNGPVGAFEYKPFDQSTVEIAVTVKNYARKLNINTLAGGGDTISSIKSANAESGFTYISSAGGAFLEWLEGKESPGVIALNKNNF